MNRIVLVAALLAAGCSTARPLSPFTSLPSDTPKECTKLCQSMGLQLTAVVVVASSAGCVCEAQPGAARPSGATAAASGGAVVALQEAEAAAQQQQHMQQQQQPLPPVIYPQGH